MNLFYKMSFITRLIILIQYTQNTYPFDWAFYTKTYLKNKSYHFIDCMSHYMHIGINHGYKSSSFELNNTNFDWQYYVEKNKLTEINTESEAWNHYITIGKHQQLIYCKSFNIAICIHIANLNQIKMLINILNFFMVNNPHNTYTIYIAITTTHIINEQSKKKYLTSYTSLDKNYIDKIVPYSPYHASLIDTINAPILYAVKKHMQQKLIIPKSNINFMFIENRGLDIGSFLLQMDQIIKNNESPDFIVKIHTKTNSNWASMLFSFMNIKINRLLNYYDAVYTCNIKYPDIYFSSKRDKELFALTKKYTNAPDDFPATFNFCGGTMFIVSGKIIDYMSSWNFKTIFDYLPLGKTQKLSMCHAFERYFGGIIDAMNMRVCHLGYCPPHMATTFGADDVDL